MQRKNAYHQIRLYNMKSVIFSILIVALLLSPLCAIWGQSTVSEVNNTKSDTTIVRYWQDGISVVYTHNVDNNNWFLLVDTTVPHVRRIAVPSDVTVNDFRILHDTVYIGGHHVDGSGTQRGLLAFFDIHDFYRGMGNFIWAVSLLSNMYDCYIPATTIFYCQNQIYDITRLAVYDSSGSAKIAFIAKNFVDVATDTRVGIGCARYNGSSWSRVLLYNKYAIEEYTDIIATQNYVVAVARTNDSARLAMRIFPKSTFIQMSHMPSWPPNCYYYSDKYGQGLADLEVDENIMATALNNDEFAVAYHHTNVTTEGIAVKTFGITGGLASLQNGLNATVTRQSGSIWKMRDICYSPTTKRLIVLNDFDGGTVGGQASIVYQFQYPTLASGPYYGFYLLDNNLHALSPFVPSSNIFIASGNNILTGLLSPYWQNALTNLDTGCELIDEIMCTNTSTPLYSTFMETNLNIPDFYGNSTPFVVDEVERVVICNQ